MLETHKSTLSIFISVNWIKNNTKAAELSCQISSVECLRYIGSQFADRRLKQQLKVMKNSVQIPPLNKFCAVQKPSMVLFCISNHIQGGFTPIFNFQADISQTGSPGVALMQGFLLALMQHQYTNISPSRQTLSPLLCNYCMHACADGTQLLLFGGFAAVAPVWLSCVRPSVCVPF